MKKILVVGDAGMGARTAAAQAILDLKDSTGYMQGEIVPIMVNHARPMPDYEYLKEQAEVDKMLAHIDHDAGLRNEMMKVEAERGLRFLEKEDKFAYGKPTRAERRAEQRKLKKKQ
jgi:hypothetical protein